jgi:DNA-binding IclR family transcriptional regulator
VNRAVARAVDLIELVSQSPEGLTLSELARALGAPKSTLWSIVRALEERHVLTHGAQGRTYTLGLKLLELGDRARRQPALQRVARPFLIELGRATGEAVFLSVVEREEVVYIDKVDSSQAIRYIADVGTRRPLHCTSVGKLYLSLLPEAEAIEMAVRHGLKRYTPATITEPARLKRELAATRARGYSVSREEFLEGVIGIASPVLSADREFVAALTVSAVALRMAGREPEVAAFVIQASGRLTKALRAAGLVPTRRRSSARVLRTTHSPAPGQRSLAGGTGRRR